MRVVRIGNTEFLVSNVKKITFKKYKELHKNHSLYKKVPLKDRETRMAKDYEKITGKKIKTGGN